MALRSPTRWRTRAGNLLRAAGLVPRLVVYRGLLLRRGIQPVARRVNQRRLGRPVDSSAAELRRITRAVWRASRMTPGTSCLHRALVATEQLRMRGVDAQTRLGLGRLDGALTGHAWVEVNGERYLEEVERQYDLHSLEIR